MVKPKEYTLHTSMTVAGQPVVNYDYYDNGWLENVRQVVNSVEQRFNFVYDDGGRRERLKSFNGVSLVTETIYGFDNASRLLEMKHLDSLNIELEVLNYLYDPNSNRTTMNRPSVNLPLPNQVSNTSYNEANQMLSFNDKNISYDNNGNMESVTNSCGTTTYTWNAKNQLVNISGFNTDCSSLTASFKYDALGRRFEKTINGTTTQYVYDGVDIIQELNGDGTVKANYIRGLNIDEPLARITQNAVRFYMTDALGSVIALTDDTGAVKTTYSYDPFGNVTISGESSDNPFQFAGRENDNTGHLFERNRYYSYELLRYISEDPIGFAGGDINFYVRVGNSPVNFIDPLGLKTWIYISGSFVPPVIPGEIGTYFLVDPSTGIYHQFVYASGGVGFNIGFAVQLEGGTFEGPCDPTKISDWSLSVSGFAAAGKGLSGQITGTSFWGNGEIGATGGIAGGAGAGIAGMVTRSWYLGQGNVLPDEFKKIYQQILKQNFNK